MDFATFLQFIGAAAFVVGLTAVVAFWHMMFKGCTKVF